MAVEIGALRALLSLDSAAFEKGAKRAQASMNGLQRGLTQAADKMGQVGRKLTTRVTLPLVGMAAVAVKSSLSTIDAQSKMAQSLGTSTESMQVLARAADRAGLSTGEFEQVARQLTKRLSQAATGSGPAVKALEQIGLKAEDLADMELDQKIAVINRAIADMVPEAEQAAVAAALFGDRAGLLASRLDSDTIAKAADEVQRFGIAVTEVEADKIEEANDAISAIGLVTRGLANQVTVALAPTLIKIAETIADWGAAFNALAPEMKRFIGITAVVAAAIGPLAIALGFVATGLAALASPIGLVVLAFGAAAGVAAYVAANWDDLIERFPWLETGMQKVGDVFSAAWEGIKGVVQGAADTVNAAIQAIIGLLTGDLQGAVDGLMGMWEGWKATTDAAINGILNIIEAIVPGFRQAVADIIAAVEALPAKLLKMGQDAVQAFVYGMLQKWNELKETVASIFRLDDVGAQAIESGRQLGVDNLNGYIQGVRETLPQAEAEIRDYMNSVEDAARDETKTQSPSLVWMDLGRDLMGGLSLGIDSEAVAAAESAAAAAGRVTAAASAAGPVLSNVPDNLRDTATEVSSLQSSFASMFSSAAQGAQSFSDFLSQIGQQLANMLIDNAFQAIFSGGGGGGSLLGSLFSFDGGGYTGTGARSGGVDGKGGFPAILHPNETVIDHTKGQSMGGGVVLNFAPVIDARGADASAVARIEQQQRQMAAEFEGRVHGVLRTGRNTRRNKVWSGA